MRLLRVTNGTLYVVLAVLIVGILLTLLNVYELRRLQTEHCTNDHSLPLPRESRIDVNHSTPRIAWIPGQTALKHVRAVLERVGFTITQDERSDWELMWSWRYPFIERAELMQKLKPHQKVNHFPGCGHITNKNSLATSNIRNIPKSFKLPEHKAEFLKEVSNNPNELWVQKSNSHRGIKITKIKDMDLTAGGSFLQKFVSNPLLIDKRKFDIGVYTVLTSIDPLRVYVLDSEALFRYCSEDYEPFDADELRSYVVGDDYTPTWKMPSLKTYYEGLRYSHKDSFNAYLSKNGYKQEQVWDEIYETIREVYEKKESDMMKAASRFKTISNFFEMVRFDFLVDVNLDVYLMEVNMSPNLSSGHFIENRLLYEQVVMNTLSLVGVARASVEDWERSQTPSRDMLVSDQDLVTGQELETQRDCLKNCKHLECRLSLACLTYKEKIVLKAAYNEHVNRMKMRRVLPRTQSPVSDRATQDDSAERNLSPMNRLLTDWFQAKCYHDNTWC